MVTMNFNLVRTTKNTGRFDEQKDGHPVAWPYPHALYLDKRLLEQLGNPQRVKVTVEPIPLA